MKLSQLSFSAGEISPSVYARADIAKYGSGLRTCRNFIVRPTGGVSNRPGTQYIGATKYPGRICRLIPFVFSQDQAYVLEVGHQYIRVYADGAVILSGMSPLEIVTTYDELELDDLRFTQSADVMTLTHPSHKVREFKRLTATTFDLSEVDFVDGPFLDDNDNDSIYVYSTAKLGNVTLSSTRSIFKAGHVGALFKLYQRTFHSIRPWEPTKVMDDDPSGNGEGSPFGLMRTSDGKTYKCLTTESSGASSLGTYTGTVRPTHDKGVQADGDHSHIQDLATFAGVLWEYQHSGFGIVRITGFLSGTAATATVLSQLPDDCVGGITASAGPWTMTGDGSDTTLTITGATSDDPNNYELSYDGIIQDTDVYSVDSGTDVMTFYTAPAVGVSVSARQLSQNNRTNVWAFGAWSEDQGYPSIVTYYQDRLVFAATKGQPQTEFASKTGDYHKFGVSSPIVDDDAITQTLNARQINEIRELIPLDQLISITATSAWASPKRGSQWTPDTIGFDPQSYRGCAPIRAAIIDESAVFAQDQATKVGTLNYSFNSDKFSGTELTVLSRHLFSSTKPIVDMDYAREPDGILWCVRGDGALVGNTYLPEQEVNGWHRHDTINGAFERLCAIPEDGRSAVYFIVRRTIAGQNVRYIERLASRGFEALEDAYFVDCGLSYEGVPDDSFGGLSHLEGQDVVALADGNVIRGLTVKSGAVNLGAEYSRVHVGLPVEADIETLDFVIQGRESVRDNTKNIPKISMTLEDSRGLKVGPDADHLEEFITRELENWDEATQMINGVAKAYVPNSWNVNGRVFARQSDPLPATILAILPQVEIGGSG